MPGVLKKFNDLFFEFFYLSFGYNIFSQEFENLCENSFYYSLIHSIKIFLGDYDVSLFSEIASDLINFCDGEGKLLVVSIRVDYIHHEITIVLPDDFFTIIQFHLKKFWTKNLSRFDE